MGSGEGGQTGDGDGDGGDPFPPDYPTTGGGWSERYQNLPWLSDDLDNDDFFVTGNVDGHDVIGFICAGGNGWDGWATTVDGGYVEVQLDANYNFSTTVLRQTGLPRPSGNGTYDITYNGFDTWTQPSEPQGTSTVVPNVPQTLAHSFEYSGLDDRATFSTATITFDFLGIPASSREECYAENEALRAWVIANGGIA